MTDREGDAPSDRRSPTVRGQVFLRPLGTPLPLGFLGLVGGTVVVAGLELGWLAPAEGAHVGWILLAFAVPLQFLTCVLAFLARDAVIGTGMGVLGGTWLATGLTLLTSLPGAVSDALALLLFVSAAALLVPIVSAGASKLAASAVLSVACVRFTVTGVYELTGLSGWKTAAGWCGVALAVVAVCAALAFESEAARGRPLLPTLREDPQRNPMMSAGVESEPGVHKRL
jgi:succinate-acetate transporter protein